MKKAVLMIVIIVLIISCKKVNAPTECQDGCVTFYFQNPQPDNDSELDHFPNKFRGLYVNNDSTFIRIEEDRVLQEYFWKFKVHKSTLELDSVKTQYNIVNDKLISKERKEKYDMVYRGDSIELIEKRIDTLFRFSFYEKVKRFDGQLIMSRKDSVFWRVQFVSIDKDTLKFKEIYDLKDLRKLDSVTKTKSKMIDSTSYLIKPTKGEFKKILKIKDLGFDRKYKKISK